jgi:protocatechuate 3,4-dioxygenase beta subunit
VITVLPGRYPNGRSFRPRHIHYKVRAPGFPELTTQLYFEGDEFITTDPWARVSRSIIPLRRDSAGARGTFDLILG